jgi:hypothetical protein
VQDIELVQRHCIQQAQDKLKGEDMPTHIEHQPTPGKARFVLDFHCRDRPAAFHGQQLAQRLYGIEQPGRFRRPQRYPLCIDGQLIALIAQCCIGPVSRHQDGPGGQERSSLLTSGR